MQNTSKRLLFLSLPMSITQLITVGSGFACMAMVAQLGHDVLAASALIFTARISLLLVGGSILFALSILVGHANGAKDFKSIGNFMQQGWTLALLISLVILIIFWHMDTILLWFGQAPALTAIVKEFFHANIWNVVPFLLALCNQQLIYGLRKQKFDLIANLIAVVVLLITAYLFIFGQAGFPALGVAGLGYALALQAWTYFLITSGILIFNPFFKQFELFNYRVHKNWHHFTLMFKVGWAISMQIGGEMLSFFAIATIVGWMGSNSLAAYQVINQYQMLSIIPLFALAQASGILIGQSFGSKNYDDIKSYGKAALIFSFTFSVIVAVLFLVFPKELATAYLDVDNPTNAETVYWIVILFSIIAFLQIFDGLRNVLTGSLRGLLDTCYPMYVGLFSIWVVGIPLGYFIAFHVGMGVAGMAIGSTIGMLVGCLWLMCRWQYLIKQYS